MDEMWGPVIGSLGFTMLIITPIIVNKIIKFKLELAKINAKKMLYPYGKGYTPFWSILRILTKKEYYLCLIHKIIYSDLLI